MKTPTPLVIALVLAGLVATAPVCAAKGKPEREPESIPAPAPDRPPAPAPAPESPAKMGSAKGKPESIPAPAPDRPPAPAPAPESPAKMDSLDSDGFGVDEGSGSGSGSTYEYVCGQPSPAKSDIERALKVHGQSGKFTLYESGFGSAGCDPSSLQITMDALHEIAEDGATQVGKSGKVKHSINTFAPQSFTINPARDIQLGGVDATLVQFVTPFKGLADANLRVDTFMFDSPGLVGTPTEAWETNPGDFKFNIVLSDWDWCGCKKGRTEETGAFVDVVITLRRKGAAASVGSDIIELESSGDEVAASGDGAVASGDGAVEPEHAKEDSPDGMGAPEEPEPGVSAITTAAASAALSTTADAESASTTVESDSAEQPVTISTGEDALPDGDASPASDECTLDCYNNGKCVFVSEDCSDPSAPKTKQVCDCNPDGAVGGACFYGRTCAFSDQCNTYIGKENTNFCSWNTEQDGFSWFFPDAMCVEAESKPEYCAASTANRARRARKVSGTYGLLGDMTVRFSNQVRLDGVWQEMPEGYPSVAASGDKLTCTFRFPKFNSEAFYDPIVQMHTNPDAAPDGDAGATAPTDGTVGAGDEVGAGTETPSVIRSVISFIIPGINFEDLTDENKKVLKAHVRDLFVSKTGISADKILRVDLTDASAARRRSAAGVRATVVLHESVPTESAEQLTTTFNQAIVAGSVRFNVPVGDTTVVATITEQAGQGTIRDPNPEAADPTSRPTEAAGSSGSPGSRSFALLAAALGGLAVMAGL